MSSHCPDALNVPLSAKSGLIINFNEASLSVDAPETNKLVKFVLFNNDVDVKFKLLIDKVELVDKLFKLLNIVLDAAFKL